MTCVKKSKLIFRGAHRLTGTGIVESLEIVDIFGQARATVMRATRNGVSPTTKLNELCDCGEIQKCHTSSTLVH